MTSVPTRITFRGITPSPALEHVIHVGADGLRQYAPDITSCRVVVDVPHRHQHQRSFHVRVSVAVPDAAPLIVERQLPARDGIKDHENYDDAYALVRDAFDVTRRRLQDVVHEQRGFVKSRAR